MGLSLDYALSFFTDVPFVYPGPTELVWLLTTCWVHCGASWDKPHSFSKTVSLASYLIFLNWILWVWPFCSVRIILVASNLKWKLKTKVYDVKKKKRYLFSHITELCRGRSQERLDMASKNRHSFHSWFHSQGCCWLLEWSCEILEKVLFPEVNI